MLLAGESRTLDGIDDSTQDDGTRALDVIVEACVNVAVALQCGERILEVLELNDNTRKESDIIPGNFRYVGRI